jgi:Secretion system C-terminal sorting domain/Fibronectin type III domain
MKTLTKAMGKLKVKSEKVMTKSMSLIILFLLICSGVQAQTQITMNMVWVGSTANTADFDVVLINTGTTTLKFNGIIIRGPHAPIATISSGGTVSWNSLNNNTDPAWNNGIGVWPNQTANLPYSTATAFNLNYSSSNIFFTNANAPTIPTGAGVNIGRFRVTLTGGTWNPNSEFGFVWHSTAAVIAYVNGATTTTSISGASIIKNVPVTQPLNSVAVGSTSTILSGTASICAGASTNLSAAIVGGTSPYTLVYSNGTSNTTLTNYVSGTPIPVTPSATTTYSIVSVHDAASLIGVGNSGTPTVTVNPILTPSFTSLPASICAGASYTFPGTSNNGIAGTWSPALNNAATTTYTFTPNAGTCSTGPITHTIVVNPIVTPTFTAIAPKCSGSSFTLPATSNNGITGTWSPAINNLATTTYTFTPSAGQCATTTTLQVVIVPNVTPTFTQIPGICTGGTFTLPTVSNNGITGTWSPAVNNTSTTTYTFTPTAGQCATTATMTVGVSAPTTPSFTQIPAICVGGTFTLPTTSNNGITGSWSPAINNQTGQQYTFTPNPGQCASTTTMIVAVNQPSTPFFVQIPPICAGTSYTLPTTSTNGISGTWSPAVNTNATTTYTFTPNAGSCATTTTMTVSLIVVPAPVNVLAINVYAVTATISWANQVLPAGGFFSIEYRPVASPTWISGGTATASQNTKLLTGLSQGTAYEARVRGNCSASVPGAWSASAFFNTIVSPCNTPLVLNAASNTGNSITVTWTAIPGATWYEFEYKQTSSATWIPAGTVPGTVTSKIFTGLLPSTSYDFRSRTYCPDNTNSPWSAILTSVTDPLSGCSLPPQIVAAPVLGTSATVSWATIAGAAYYEFRYKPASSSVWIPGGTASSFETFKNYTGLTVNTLYDFEGRTFCPNGVSSAWGAIQFTTTAAPSGCELPAVLNPTATTTSGSILVSWTPVVGATLYELQYKQSSSSVWINSGTVSAATTSELFSGLLNNTSYDFQIKTYCSTGVISPWSATSSYTTDISLAGLEDLSILDYVLVYPNPTSDVVNIKFAMKTAGNNTEFKVVDITGRIIESTTYVATSGTNEMSFDLSKVAHGIYTIMMYDNSELIYTSKVKKN